MPKFLLIDHSIIKVGGHYLEYAQNVLNAAEQMGYKIYLATNKGFSKDSEIGKRCTVVRAYKHDVWGKKAEERDRIKSLGQMLGSLKNMLNKIAGKGIFRLNFSNVGYALRGMASREFYMNRNEPLLKKIATLFFMILCIVIVAIPVLIIVVACKVLKQIFMFFKSIIIKLLVVLGLKPQHLEKLKVLVFNPSGNCKQLYSKLRNTEAGNEFGKATLKVLKKTQLSDGDIIFIPTLSIQNIQALSRLLEHNTRARKYKWNIVLRRNIFSGREPEYISQIYDKAEIRNVFKGFNNIPNVHFYTDTEELTDQYNRISTLQFHTLPIPINPGFTYNEKSNGNPKKVVYGGDARSEKGYHLIPEIVEKLYEDYVKAGKIMFELQSNFAFKNNADIDAVIARKKLEEFSGQGVRLYMDALSSVEYCGLITNGHIGLLLYNRDNYYARSSGALVECLAAGLPVIVPSGSWLSSQIEEENNKYQMLLRSELEAVTSYHMEDLSIQYSNEKKQKMHQITGNRLVLSNSGNQIKICIPVKHTCDSIYITYDLDELIADGVYVRVKAVFFDMYGQTIDATAQDYKKNNTESYKKALIFRVPEQTDKIELSLYTPFSNAVAIINDLSVSLCNGASQLAIRYLGFCYTDISEVPDDIAEIVQKYDFYEKSARLFSRKWNTRHNSVNLIQTIEKCSGLNK